MHTSPRARDLSRLPTSPHKTLAYMLPYVRPKSLDRRALLRISKTNRCRTAVRFTKKLRVRPSRSTHKLRSRRAFRRDLSTKKASRRIPSKNGKFQRDENAMSVDYVELPMPSLVRSATPGSSSCASSEGPSTPPQAHTYLSPAYSSPSACTYSYSGWGLPVVYADAHLSGFQQAYAPPAYCEEDIEMADVVSDEVAKYIGNHSAPCPWWESSDDAMEDIDDMFTTPYMAIQPETERDVEPTPLPATVAISDLVSRPQTINVLAQGPPPQATEPVLQQIDRSGGNEAPQSTPADAASTANAVECLSDDTVPFPALDDLFDALYPDDGLELGLPMASGFDQDPLNFEPLPDLINDIAQTGIDINELLATYSAASQEPSLAAPATTEIDSPLEQPFDLNLALQELDDCYSACSILHDPTTEAAPGTDVHTSAVTVNGSLQTTRDATDYSSTNFTLENLPLGIIPSITVSTPTELLDIVASNTDSSIATTGSDTPVTANEGAPVRSEHTDEMFSVSQSVQSMPSAEVDSALVQALPELIAGPTAATYTPCTVMTTSISEEQDPQPAPGTGTIQPTAPVPVQTVLPVSIPVASDVEETPSTDTTFTPLSTTAADTELFVSKSRAVHAGAAEGDPHPAANDDNSENSGVNTSSDSTSEVDDESFEAMIAEGKLTQGWLDPKKTSCEEKERRPKKGLPRRPMPVYISTPGSSTMLSTLTPTLCTTVDADQQRAVDYPTSSCADASSIETGPQQSDSVDRKGKGKDSGRATGSCTVIEAEQASGPSLSPGQMSPQSPPLDQTPVLDIAREEMTTSAPGPARSSDSASIPKSCMPESSHRHDDSTTAPVPNLSFDFNSAPSGASLDANADSTFVFGTEDFEAPMYPGEGILDFSK